MCQEPILTKDRKGINKNSYKFGKVSNILSAQVCFINCVLILSKPRIDILLTKRAMNLYKDLDEVEDKT